jgi:hypothetical protein
MIFSMKCSNILVIIIFFLPFTILLIDILKVPFLSCILWLYYWNVYIVDLAVTFSYGYNVTIMFLAVILRTIRCCVIAT